MMGITDVESRNHKWVSPGVIDMEIHHQTLGWIPYTAVDGDESSQAFFDYAFGLLGPFPEVFAPVVSETSRAEAALPKADLLFKLARDLKVISDAEAVASAKSGEIPGALAVALSTMADDEQLRAQLSWASAQQIGRLDPLLTRWAGAAYGDASEQVLDSLFGLGVK